MTAEQSEGKHVDRREYMRSLSDSARSRRASGVEDDEKRSIRLCRQGGEGRRPEQAVGNQEHVKNT